MDIEAKAPCQLLAFLKDINSQYTRELQPFRTDDFEKNVKAKKFPPFSPANYIAGQFSQLDSSAFWSNKENS